MRVYVHHESLDFTCICNCDNESAVSDLKSVFIAQFAKQHPNVFETVNDFEFFDNHHKKIDNKAIISKVCEDREDIFVNRSNPASKPQSQPQSPLPSPPTPQPKTQAQEPPSQTNGNNGKTAPPPSPLASPSVDTDTDSNPFATLEKLAKSGDLNSSQTKAVVLQCIKKALDLANLSKAKGNFRHAKSIYRQVLNIMPTCKLCYDGLAEIYLKIEKFELAIDCYIQSIKINASDGVALLNLADAYYLNEEYANAIEIYKLLLQKIDNNTNDPDRDILAAKLHVSIAKCLFEIGEVQAALALVVNILQCDESHREALLLYGRIQLHQNKTSEAVKVFLRLLVDTPEDKELRALISDVTMKPNGLKNLKGELGEAATSPAALAFLAVIIKDYGAVEQATELYSEAFKAKPTFSAYALNLIHTYEVLMEYQKAFDTMKEFFRKNVNNNEYCSLIRETTEKFVQLLEGVTDVFEMVKKRNQEDYEQNKSYKLTTALIVNKLPAPTKAPSVEGASTYSTDELDVIATFFTVAKILFICGHFPLLPKVTEIMEQIRIGQEFHLTSSRNEHAYYCCIAQLLPFHCASLPSYEEIYVAGDSHCLSTAWQSITVKEKNFLLRPLLVTGLKTWHLRPTSRFFPKNNFYNAMKLVPKGAKIIFIFGEIDCREGLVLSVEKCKYKDIEEGALVSVNYYIEVLLALAAEKDLEIFVHPVNPVLDETRTIVTTFNAILKRRVLESTPLKWLDFFENLLTPKGSLKAEYKLDGTHISPNYLSNLSKSLEPYF